MVDGLCVGVAGNEGDDINLFGCMVDRWVGFWGMKGNTNLFGCMVDGLGVGFAGNEGSNMDGWGLIFWGMKGNMNIYVFGKGKGLLLLP